MAVKITIELTEEESRSATVSRQVVPGTSEQDGQTQVGEAADGGAPSEELLASIGGGASGVSGKTSGPTGDGGSGTMNGGSPTDGGEPASWMSIDMRGIGG